MYKSVIVLAAIVASASAFVPAPRGGCASGERGEVRGEGGAGHDDDDDDDFVPSNFSPPPSHATTGRSPQLFIDPFAITFTAIRAEDVDYEAQFKKLQKEAEERLDDKVEELMRNIDTVGTTAK
ncbi:hypothetical protein ACHAXA_003813 [Cyclostephanos tholiformis]|uniref:Uncharacterized protein n=1 Tax=Cyclostephanos tholiformis TaxID=382380 RepID=A0ABD3RWK5_9STRA